MLGEQTGALAATHLDPSYLDHKHGGSEHVTSVVTPELDASNFFDLVEVDGLNLLHALLQVGLRVQHVVCRDVTAGGQEDTGLY